MKEEKRMKRLLGLLMAVMVMMGGMAVRKHLRITHPCS